MRSRPGTVLRSVALCAAVLLLASALAAQERLFGDGFETGDAERWWPDEGLLRALIAGPPPDDATVSGVLDVIARGGGLPVGTAQGTFLFAADCGGEAWSLAGDFNGWQPAPLQKTGTLCWSEWALSTPWEAAYKLHDGSVFFGDPRARRYRFDGYGQTSLVRSAAVHQERWPGFGPEVALAPRSLQVLVPAGAIHHVLYMQDGQNLFDPAAPFGGWHLQDVAPAGMLVVGIESTADRTREYTMVSDVIAGATVGGGGAAYADLLQLHVRPFVEHRYGSGAPSGILGSSLGGAISLATADRYPEAFAFAGSLSGSLGWGSIDPATHNPTVVQTLSAAGHRSITLYLDSGGGGSCVDSDADGLADDGSDADNFCVTAQLRDALVKAGYVLDADLYYVYAPGAAHDEVAWAARVPVPLAIFAGF